MSELMKIPGTHLVGTAPAGTRMHFMVGSLCVAHPDYPARSISLVELLSAEKPVDLMKLGHEIGPSADYIDLMDWASEFPEPEQGDS